MNKRIAIVTGAANGIGKAISKRLTSEDYFVILADINKAEGKDTEIELGTEKSLFIYCDCSNENNVLQLFQTLYDKFKRIDILVNNAGIIRDNMIWNMPIEDFNLVMDVNLKASWLMCREAAKVMKVQRSGRIVNITSRAWLGNRGQSNYSASKAGVIGLTRVLALELGKYNVLVNAIAPGLIDTPLTQKLDKEVLDKLINAQPTNTMGRPEDIAHVVSFLVSDKTNFITGQTIYVDGGKSIGAGI